MSMAVNATRRHPYLCVRIEIIQPEPLEDVIDDIDVLFGEHSVHVLEGAIVRL